MTSKRATALSLVLGLGLLAAASGPLPAHVGATGVVKQRMDDMKAAGRALRRAGGRLKARRGLGEIAADAEAIRAAAARMPSVFPRGGRDHPSEAKAAIWNEWPGFVAAAALLEREAEKLAAVAASGSEAGMTAQLRSVTRACGSCHDRFRSSR